MDYLPEERRLAILELVRQHPIVRATEIAERFGVSLETVRRDFADLEQDGLVRRVYGGITRVTTSAAEAPFDLRRVANLGQKRAMARLAASLVEPGDMLILDVGTSVAEVATALAPGYRGRVLTNSLLVTAELAGRDAIELLSAGGRVRSGDLALYGPGTEAFFRDFYGGTAFLGSGGVDPVAGLTDFHLDEIATRRLIISRADRAYVMADSSKLGHVAPVSVCDLTEVTAVITDSNLTDATAAAFEEAGVTLLVAPVEGHPAGEH